MPTEHINYLAKEVFDDISSVHFGLDINMCHLQMAEAD